jgi:predicted CoA-binding protein
MNTTEDWRECLVDGAAGIAEILESSRRIAVLGIKTEAQQGEPAIEVPRYMADHGYEIVPVPVYFPDATEILGQKVFRTISEVPGALDMVNIFRRSRDVAMHVDDIVAARPRFVWMQSGIANDLAAEAFARAGIRVVQDRCLMVEHARWSRRQR